MAAFLKYESDNLIGAGARVLIAPATEDAPAEITDVFGEKTPYAVVGDWEDIGATSGPAVITRGITVSGFNIQQEQAVLLEEPTEVSRTLAIPFAEFTSSMLTRLEEGTASTSAARDKVEFGAIPSLTNYRIALAVQKSKQQGIVQEGSTLASANFRGAFVVWAGYNATLTADSVAVSIGKGELANGTLTFKLSPDTDVVDANVNQGLWLIEKAPRTIP